MRLSPRTRSQRLINPVFSAENITRLSGLYRGNGTSIIVVVRVVRTSLDGGTEPARLLSRYHAKSRSSGETIGDCAEK